MRPLALLITAASLLLGPTLVSASCKTVNNGATCQQPFVNQCGGGQGQSFIVCCDNNSCT
ncbi:hypothetical protein LZ31DRAFT_294422 [Colletotrichum somersetense]|nr:hypothetical protein LZ31DRAFT_294422 [Colletotrichum somersetense]